MARDLAAGVHAPVRAARDRQLDRLAQHGGERLLHNPLHGAPSRLARPAGELRAVVFE